MENLEKQILLALSEEDELLASDIRDSLGLEQNQQVHYRMDGSLEEYVTTVRREQQAGAAAAARVYALTEAGRKWVEEHGNDISITDLGDAEAEIQQLRSEISDLSDNLEQAVEWHQKDAGHYAQLRAQVEDLGDEITAVRRKAASAKGSSDSLRDDVSDAQRRLDELDERLRELEYESTERGSSLDTLETRLDSIAERVEHLEDYASKESDVVSNLQQRVEHLEDEQPDGLLDLLLS